MRESADVEETFALEIEEDLESGEVEVVEALDDDDVEIADTETETTGSEPVAFTELGLPEELVKKLAENGVQTTFPIQAATIPDALAGRHVLGKARTGSGKTLAFGLAALANLKGKRARKGKPLALVLVPTRELAMQVSDALQPYGFAVGADIASVYGGAPMYKQVFALRRGVEVLVATPGRLTDLIEQGECDLSEVEIAILDEADQMADMGFMPIVSELLSQTDPTGQRLLFSATLDGAVDELVRQYMTDPVLHSVTPDSDDSAQMDHHLLIVEPADKALVVAEIAARHTPGDDDGRRTILFARTKLGADRIAEKIREAGVSALALHGGMTQRARTKTLADFKDGRVPVLVATDVAARGIHVDGIDLVLHVDPAGDPKDYLHRAGRTARAGESGTVVTLVLPKQRKSTVRLLESAGIDAELTKVTPSSEALRELTGGRPVAEYVAEADAYHATRRAAREARLGGDDRREGRDSRDGFRGGREGFRPGRSEFRQDRDRFDRGHSGGRFQERDGRGFGGGERSGFGGGDRRGSEGRGGFGGGERRSFGDRDGAQGRTGGFNRDSRGSEGRTGGFSGERRSFGDRDGAQGRSFDRDNRGGSENRSGGFSGERRSFGDRDGAQGRTGGFNRDNRSSEGRTGGYTGERRSFGDRDGAQGRTGGYNRDNRGSGTGGYTGERRSFGDRDGAQGRTGGFNRDNRSSEGRTGGFSGERRSFGDRNGSQGRSFDRDNRGGSENRTGGFNRDNRSSEGRTGGYNRGSEGRTGGYTGERRSFGDRDGAQGRTGGYNRDNRGSEGRTGGFSGERRTFDRNGSQGRSFDRDNRDNRGGTGERRSFGDRDAAQNRGAADAAGDRRPSRDDERRTFGERTAFGRPRGGYSNEQRDNRPPRDRRW
ncbi:DEAD/DEAH box helicase [Catenulispora rubra]|uniref:DEAD/DEAH box helicase n=1 Tax=Catenulispora rubra TaxID=280293 RepID=UPI002B2724C2|nr:DEAD/DEAH box helicase [Catenulispora rubra]